MGRVAVQQCSRPMVVILAHRRWSATVQVASGSRAAPVIEAGKCSRTPRPVLDTSRRNFFPGNLLRCVAAARSAVLSMPLSWAGNSAPLFLLLRWRPRKHLRGHLVELDLGHHGGAADPADAYAEDLASPVAAGGVGAVAVVEVLALTAGRKAGRKADIKRTSLIIVRPSWPPGAAKGRRIMLHYHFPPISVRSPFLLPQSHE